VQDDGPVSSEGPVGADQQQSVQLRPPAALRTTTSIGRWLRNRSPELPALAAVFLAGIAAFVFADKVADAFWRDVLFQVGGAAGPVSGGQVMTLAACGSDRLGSRGPAAGRASGTRSKQEGGGSR